MQAAESAGVAYVAASIITGPSVWVRLQLVWTLLLLLRTRKDQQHSSLFDLLLLLLLRKEVNQIAPNKGTDFAVCVLACTITE